MKKLKTVFVCENCGFESYKWLGKCPECGAWNTIVEEIKDRDQDKSLINYNNINLPKSIKDINSSEYERYNTGIGELNRVLGGGLVKGSIVLISGDPGIGKSTLLLQSSCNIAHKYGKTLYVSGEESEEQIKMRGNRLNIIEPNLFIVSETNVDIIKSHIEDIQPKFVVIDSIQTVYNSQISSAPGSVSQVRECSNLLIRLAKSKNIPFFIVAHVTKQGELAGPRVMEHMVDTVLTFEGENTQEYRILRTKKNRFGTTSEIGVFEMNDMGLKEITNPSEIFLEEDSNNKEGSVVVGIMEGTRPILVEIQALVSETKAYMPRRTAVGVDISRLNLILAVLEKKMRISFYNCDVYVNVVGGLNLDGTFGDLGIALALISSVKSQNLKLNKTVLVGEIGLTSEIRPVAHCERIVNEANKMGFKNIVMPKRNMEKLSSKYKNINLIGVSSLREAVNAVFKN